MLVFFLLQGLYVFVVYFILHNQTCCPMKASYTVEMNGHPGPSTAFFTPGSGMPPAGGEISKSTQNLISAMEEVPALALSLSLSLFFFFLSLSESLSLSLSYTTFLFYKGYKLNDATELVNSFPTDILWSLVFDVSTAVSCLLFNSSSSLLSEHYWSVVCQSIICHLFLQKLPSLTWQWRNLLQKWLFKYSFFLKIFSRLSSFIHPNSLL